MSCVSGKASVKRVLLWAGCLVGRCGAVWRDLTRIVFNAGCAMANVWYGGVLGCFAGLSWSCILHGVEYGRVCCSPETRAEDNFR